MTIPPIPWWIRLFDGGNAKTTAIAAVAFALGYMFRGDGDHWKHLAGQAHKHFQEAGYNREYYGKHTDREHDRRQHRHGEGYER